MSRNQILAMVYPKSVKWVKKQSYFLQHGKKKFISERHYNLEVIDITPRGKGVVKSEEGKVIFVSGVVPGDKINVETYKKRSGYFEANLIEILEPSPSRIEPQCEHFGVCGGCKWQNMSYETQLHFKQKEVLHNLKTFWDDTPRN